MTAAHLFAGIAIALLGSIGAPHAGAQTGRPLPPGPLELRPGQTVWVVVDDDTEIRGKVASASTVELQLLQDGALRSIAMHDVRRIETRDPLRNGTILGAIAGAATFGAWYGLLAAQCHSCGFDNDVHEVVNGLEFAALGAGIGAVAGLSVDALVKKRRVIYVAPIFRGRQSRSNLTRPIGLTITVSW